MVKEVVKVRDCCFVEKVDEGIFLVDLMRLV